MSLTRPKPDTPGVLDRDRRVSLLSVLAAEQITSLGTGRFSSPPPRSSYGPRMEPEDCLRAALHIVAERRSSSEALAWFFEPGDGDGMPLDVLAQGRCAEVLQRAERA